MGPAQQWRKSGAMNECVRSFKLWRIIEEEKKGMLGKRNQVRQLVLEEREEKEEEKEKKGEEEKQEKKM